MCHTQKVYFILFIVYVYLFFHFEINVIGRDYEEERCMQVKD